MRRRDGGPGVRVGGLAGLIVVASMSVLLVGCEGEAASNAAPEASATGATAATGALSPAAQPGTREEIERGRFLVVTHSCGDCHGGVANPASEGWLAGVMSPQQEFIVGDFVTRPRNLTPDNDTGLGRFSERQIFNALRYGLRPGETPDVEITSAVPGQGNFPMVPKYLAVPMPWPSFRHLPDADLLAIAAYLKHGVKPVANRVQDSDGPPDFWASEYTPEKIGTYPLPAYPTAREVSTR